MSGEVREFQLKPMTWQEIKAMPEASQKSYLQLLIDEYGATFGNLAKMTGLGRTTVMKRFKELGVTPRPPKASTTKEERKRWSEFIGSENSPAEIIPAEDVAPTPKPRSIARSISEITLRSSNKGDLLRDFMELMEIIEGEYFTVSIDIR